MNEKLLEQLRLAKEAGTKAMAKDFFAPTPGGGESEPDGDEVAAVDGAPVAGDGSVSADVQAEGLTPEQLEELMRALNINGGGQ